MRRSHHEAHAGWVMATPMGCAINPSGAAHPDAALLQACAAFHAARHKERTKLAKNGDIDPKRSKVVFARLADVVDAHSGDPERSNRLIMNTHSGDHEHRLADA